MSAAVAPPSPASPASPASGETSRLLGIDSSDIDIALVDDAKGDAAASYAELLRSLLADAGAVADATLAPPSPPRGGGCVRRRCCCGSGRAARLPPDVEAARLTVRKMAKVKMAEDGAARRALHEGSLAAIFLELTGTEVPATAGGGDGAKATFTGQHWETIGFQGSDPSRDLRAAGMLAVLQLRYLTTTHRGMARQLLELSQHEEQYFPFATVSINVTAIVLQTLRSRACHRMLLAASDAYDDCRPETVLGLANRLYAGAMLALHTRWVEDCCTITDFQMVSEDLTASCLTDPQALCDAQPPPGAGAPPPAQMSPELPEAERGA